MWKTRGISYSLEPNRVPLSLTSAYFELGHEYFFAFKNTTSRNTRSVIVQTMSLASKIAHLLKIQNPLGRSRGRSRYLPPNGWLRLLCGVGLIVTAPVGCGGSSEKGVPTASTKQGGGDETGISKPPNGELAKQSGGDGPVSPIAPNGELAKQRDGDKPIAPIASPSPVLINYGSSILNDKFDIENWRNGTAFATAYSRVIGDADIIGKPAIEDVTRMAKQLSRNSQTSSVANFFGATIRISEVSSFKSESDAFALVKAIETCNTHYKYKGQIKYSCFLSRGLPDAYEGLLTRDDWNMLMAESGVETKTATVFLSQTAANERVVIEKRLDVLSRLHQGRVDNYGWILGCYKSSLGTHLSSDLSYFKDGLSSRMTIALLTSIHPTKIQDADSAVSALVEGLRDMKVIDEKIDRKSLRLAAIDAYAKLDRLIKEARINNLSIIINHFRGRMM